jgi:hypothetical protein
MAKNKTSKDELPVGGSELSDSVPQNAAKLTAPPLLKPNGVPVGETRAGEIVSLVENITGRKNMKRTYCFRLRHKSGKEFLFPITGTIKKDCASLFAPFDETEEKPELKLKPDSIGKKVYFTRLEDGFSDKFKKKMFRFDVNVV